MESDLQEINYIENYLLDRLSDEEKLVFEKKMKSDTEFAHRVNLQRIVLKRVQQIALKQSVNKAHIKFMRRQKYSFKNSVFRHTFNIVLTIIGILLLAWLIWNH